MRDTLSSEAPACFEIRDLSVRFRAKADAPFTVKDVSLALPAGSITGLAGESGCGKSTSAMAAIGFLDTAEVSGTAMVGDIDLLTLDGRERRALWGKEVCYVAQSAALALNPSLTIGKQFRQVMRRHLDLDGKTIHARQIELLAQMSVPRPEEALDRYPFQFSGGQLQRVALAIAMACRPKVLILDEPTTGLDVTTQAQITKLLRKLVAETGVAILYVSHDLGLLSEVSDLMAVMYAGQIVEKGPTQQVLRQPSHPYTSMLLSLRPRLEDRSLLRGIPGMPPPGVVTGACAFAPRCPMATTDCAQQAPALTATTPDHFSRCARRDHMADEMPKSEPLSHARPDQTGKLLVVDSITLTYPGAKRPSVKGVSFKMNAGECLGIVGESGSGKSSILKMIAGLYPATDGFIGFENVHLNKITGPRPAKLNKDIQLVFQNPDASLNPRHRIETILSRPLALYRPEIAPAQWEAEIAAILEKVRLPAAVMKRYPMELSGGQRQRIAIARAFLAQPKILLCDEVTSALDVSVQAAILRMISEFSQETGAAVLMISHDLALVRTIADQVIVMQNGEIVEQNTAQNLFDRPQTAYTRELLSAIPRL